jgi:hypothetical protein
VGDWHSALTISNPRPVFAPVMKTIVLDIVRFLVEMMSLVMRLKWSS